MPRLEDLVEDLQVLEGARHREALYDLLRRGAPAAQALAAAISEQTVRGKVVAALGNEPARAVTALAAAKAPMRKVLTPLIKALPDEVLLNAIWSLLAAAADVDPSVAAVAIELLEPRVSDPAGAGKAGSARAATLMRIMLGRSYMLLDDLSAALRWFAAAAGGGSGNDVRALPVAVASALLTWTARATGATGDWQTGLAIAARVAAVVSAGSDIAVLLARGLLVQPERSASMIECVLASAQTAGGAAARRDLLGEAWRAANDGLIARRSTRSGYFADQLAQVGRAVDALAAALADPLADYGPGPSAAALAAAAAATVGRLMEELVAFQPLRPVPAEPRQLLLAVTLADREDLAEKAVDVRVGPARNAIPLQLDDALARGLIRGILRGLAGATGQAATTVTLTAWTQPDGEAGAQAAFAFGVSTPGAAALSHRALATATVPDLLRRCLAHVEFRDNATAAAVDDPVDEWTFCVFLPEMAAATPKPASETELEQELVRLLAEAALAESTPADVAQSAARVFGMLAQSEIERWGRDLGLVLHDLKNSLAFIRGWLRGDSVWDEDTVRARCQENIEDMRFWLAEAGAILDAAEPTGRARYVDLREMTPRVLRGLAAVMAARRQRLSLDLPARLPGVPGSPAAVASVLRNLARNALNAMPEGGLLKVTLTHNEPDEAVLVTFLDDGPGFPGGLLAPDATGTAAATGDGLAAPQLGLASVRRLLREQGGMLRLANDPVSGGGAATAEFSTGAGFPALRGREAEWRTVLPDARRALRAAHALLQSGDTGTARHLWQTALSLEVNAMLERKGLAATHSLLPRVPALAGGSSNKPQLTPLTRASLTRAFGQDAWPRAEAAARRLLGRIATRQFATADLSLAEAAVLLCLFDIIHPSSGPTGLPAQLFQLSGELEDRAEAQEELEARVVAAVIAAAEGGANAVDAGLPG